MRNALLAIAVCLFASVASAFAADPAPKSADVPAKEPAGTLYHVVSIKFKENAKPEQIKAVEVAFAALKTKVPGITSLHWDQCQPREARQGIYPLLRSDLRG